MELGPQAEECKWPLEAGTGKEMDSLPGVSRRSVALPMPSFDFHICKITSVLFSATQLVGVFHQRWQTHVVPLPSLIMKLWSKARPSNQWLYLVSPTVCIPGPLRSRMPCSHDGILPVKRKKVLFPVPCPHQKATRHGHGEEWRPLSRHHSPHPFIHTLVVCIVLALRV